MRNEIILSQSGVVLRLLCASFGSLNSLYMLSNTFSLLAVVGPGIYLNALLPIDGRIKNHFYEASTHAALTCFLGFDPKASLSMHSLLTIIHTHYFLTR